MNKSTDLLVCRTCGEAKEPDEFYDRKNTGGKYLDCKACHLVKRRAWRAENADRVREADKALRHRKPETIREYKRRYVQRHSAERAAYTRNWRAANPEKDRAQNLANKAIRRGDLVRPSSCQVCGRTGTRIEAHHDDYSKPLEVWWLCRRCHVQADRNRQEATA